ncbi:MAG TPA: ChaN family lipoprotein, partial [Saprospiraceae bacterium]|nr:ChaN family lipoprotein [Saprospiraceae bacterium]
LLCFSPANIRQSNTIVHTSFTNTILIISIFEKSIVYPMKNLFLVLLLFLPALSQAQELKSYQLYDSRGKSVSFGKMINSLKDYDVVLFGEHHNNSINHWLELKTAEALYGKVGSRLILGCEMYERDNQPAIDRYLNDDTDAKKLGEEARLWSNHSTDYLPILDFAKEKHLRMIATNVPRRYAAEVSKKGKDSLRLEPHEVAWVVKLPYEVSMETPGYDEMLKMMGDHAGTRAMNFVAAQAIKDATMAESILNHLSPGSLFYHYEGDFHSKEYGGIYWYLKKARPDLKIAVISVSESADPALKLPADFKRTEFNLVLPEDMTKTY